MDPRENAWLRHQQQRWMRPDAYLWIRPDAARFLKPGTKVEDVYPALSRKYSPNQLRIQAGNPGGGRWTRDGGTTPQSIAPPMGSVDVGDLSGSSEVGDLFQITPDETGVDGVQLAGDLQESLGDQSDPSGEPPAIPQQMPETRDERMGFVRSAARWIGTVGRYSPAVDAYFGAVDQIEEINRLSAMIKTANDPARTLEELQAPVGSSSEAGYQDHHIAEEAAARNANDPESLIQGRDNVVRIPTLKHIDITAYYSRMVEQADGTWLSPRDALQTQDFEARRQFGLGILRRYGVLK